MTSPSPIEPDPFKNARGLSGMLAKKDGPPLWPFMIGAVAIMGVIGLRIALAEKQVEERDANMQINRLLSEQRDPSVGAGLGITTSQSSTDVLEKSRKVCQKLGCAGGPSAQSLVDDCVQQNMAMANDPLARSLLGNMLDSVLSTCGDKACTEFPSCYFDRLKAMSGAVEAPTTPASTEDRNRLKELVCTLSMETPGHLPDLNSPTASPKAKELSQLMNKIGHPIGGAHEASRRRMPAHRGRAFGVASSLRFTASAAWCR